MSRNWFLPSEPKPQMSLPFCIMTFLQDFIAAQYPQPALVPNTKHDPLFIAIYFSGLYNMASFWNYFNPQEVIAWIFKSSSEELDPSHWLPWLNRLRGPWSTFMRWAPSEASGVILVWFWSSLSLEHLETCMCNGLQGRRTWMFHIKHAGRRNDGSLHPSAIYSIQNHSGVPFLLIFHIFTHERHRHRGRD